MTLEHVIVPTHGYPWPVRVRLTYALTGAGLHVTAEGTNLGATTAPYGIGFHPWLSPGDGAVDDCTLQVDAERHVTVDDRLLPTGTEARVRRQRPAGRAPAARPRPGRRLDRRRP